MINYVKGNLFTSPDEVICHQVNCKGVYGGGISGEMFKRYPELLTKYLNHLRTYQEHAFGTMNYITDGEKHIYNLYSQCLPGPCNEFSVQFMKDNYLWRTSWLVRNLEYLCKQYNSVSIPLIGSGIGADVRLKGSMTDLEYFIKYIEPYIEHLNINVYYL